jgi:hypothetical protein
MRWRTVANMFDQADERRQLSRPALPRWRRCPAKDRLLWPPPSSVQRRTTGSRCFRKNSATSSDVPPPRERDLPSRLVQTTISTDLNEVLCFNFFL